MRYLEMRRHSKRVRPNEHLSQEGVTLARAMRRDPLAARFAQAMVAQWTGYAERLPEGGRALIILGGGYLDDSAVACLPDAPHGSWGPNFAHCEGIVLAYEAGRFVGGELLRMRMTPIE